jgi:hypothetical protein
VKFAGEAAVDAGGPARELMTDAAGSIFEPTSKLVIPTPNNREAVGDNRDTLLPFDPAGRRTDDYRTIGHVLAIILRSGLSQDLPFAPLVWKYLAGEKITKEDILEIDEQLKEHLRHVSESRESLEEQCWTCENWDGHIFTLPGHTPGVLLKCSEVDQYCWECFLFRVVSINPVLKLIRKSFRHNNGFKRKPQLSGALLSRMAQGSSLITPDHLRAITVYKDFEGPTSPYITRFWRAVDRMNPEQLRLLMKFITTLTRLPNANLNPDFRILIDRLDSAFPDQSLPTASTCFNRLHLPLYSDDDICYEKMTYAIQFCQTMENR